MSAKTGTAFASTTAEAVDNVRRHDDLVFRLDPREQRDSQRDRAVDHGDAVAATVHRGEAPFEFFDLLAVKPSPRPAAQRAPGGLPPPC